MSFMTTPVNKLLIVEREREGGWGALGGVLQHRYLYEYIGQHSGTFLRAR